mgnify:CR=1 FL=1
MYQQLISYGESDVYPFHMPGHKRRALPFPNPYTIDITEIDGFDNLHHAEGLIREAEERAAELYGADRSYYLVNGSTCGLLAAICAAARRGDKVLAARNCHKAVYHAVPMQGLAVEFLYPAITRGDLQGQITAAQVEEALTKHPDIDGILAGIKSGNLRQTAAGMGNVLEQVMLPEYPVLQRIKEAMLKGGALNAMMTGSGPTMFGIFEKRSQAKTAMALIKKQNLAKQIYVTNVHRVLRRNL